jgi:hypothetical protein
MSDAMVRYRADVESLVGRVEAGPLPVGWDATRYPKRLRDPADGGVHVLTSLRLRLRRPAGELSLFLDPLGYDVPGADGAVDLYPMPSGEPVAWFVHRDGRWWASWFERDKWQYGPSVALDSMDRDAILAGAVARLDGPGGGQA